ncbi:MAG: hypothetical protein WDW38_000943 [Sanguina aurantia]
MEGKNASLKRAAPLFPTLAAIVAHDRAGGKLTVKNSCARNLHRLMHVITFLRIILEQLTASPLLSLREAVTNAYELSLSPIHTYVVRTAVWAGMYSLPTRTAFLASIGETEESARATAAEFIVSALSITQQIEKLYDVDMPASDTVWLG